MVGGCLVSFFRKSRMRTQIILRSNLFRSIFTCGAGKKFQSILFARSLRYHDGPYGPSCTSMQLCCVLRKNQKVSNVARISSFKTRSQHLVPKTWKKKQKSSPSNVKIFWSPKKWMLEFADPGHWEQWGMVNIAWILDGNNWKCRSICKRQSQLEPSSSVNKIFSREGKGLSEEEQ